MTTSGTKTYTKNTQSLIDDTFFLLGILSEGESLTAFNYDKAKRILNSMIQGWEADNVHLWAYKEATLFLEKSTQSYELGNSVGHATESYVETALSVAADAGDGTITVDDDDGISSGDVIGIALDDDTVQWTTVNGAPAANVITLTDVLTGDAAVDNVVVTYTTKIDKPLDIKNVRFVESGTNEINCDSFSRSDYFSMANRSITGNINRYYFNPLRLSSLLYVYPTADTPLTKLNFSFYTSFDVFNNTTDEPDFPSEWYECLKYNFAERLAIPFGLAENNPTYQSISRVAKELFDKLNGYDSENNVIRIISTDSTNTNYVR